jgi:hypothetical protein
MQLLQVGKLIPQYEGLGEKKSAGAPHFMNCKRTLSTDALWDSLHGHEVTSTVDCDKDVDGL